MKTFLSCSVGVPGTLKASFRGIHEPHEHIVLITFV